LFHNFELSSSKLIRIKIVIFYTILP